MVFSALTSRVIPNHGKYSSRKGTPVSRVIVHHWAGTAGGESRMTDPNADVSCNYLVLSTGEIVGNVDEDFRAHTSGSWAADAPSITIEVQNSSTRVVNGRNDHPDSWPVTDEAYRALVRLIADIARRHGWSTITRTQVRGHQEFSSTACPGGYLWNRLAAIAASALDVFRGGGTATSPPQSSTPAGGQTQSVVGWAFNPPNQTGQLRVQKALAGRRPSRYDGPKDGVWGVNTIKGIQQTIRNVGYDGPIDGEPGENTCKYVQVYAKKYGDYTGPLDKVLGPNGWAGFALGLERP